MKLTTDDLQAIRSIVREEITVQIKPVSDRIEAVENDVKEIYFMIAGMQKDISHLQKA